MLQSRRNWISGNWAAHAGAAAGGGGSSAIPVAFDYSDFSSSTFAFPNPGGVLQPGDILIVECNNGFDGGIAGGVSGGGALTLLNQTTNADGHYISAFWKVLTGPEISTGTLTMTGANALAGCGMAVYRNATTVSYISFATSTTTGTTLAFSGFTPSGSSKGVIAAMCDRGSGSTVSAASWASRLSGASTYFAFYVQDRLSGAGAAVTFSGFDGATESEAGHLLELT